MAYAAMDAELASWTTRRDGLADTITRLLDAAEFDGRAVNEWQAKQLTHAANALVAEVEAAAPAP